LGNIHHQQSYSSPTSNTQNNSSSGALDNLMADLMSSMNDDIHLLPNSSNGSSLNVNKQQPGKRNQCHSCNEDFDYRDEVKRAGQKVIFLPFFPLFFFFFWNNNFF
jgi:hypothetical protein